MVSGDVPLPEVGAFTNVFSYASTAANRVLPSYRCVSVMSEQHEDARALMCTCVNTKYWFSVSASLGLVRALFGAIVTDSMFSMVQYSVPLRYWITHL